MPSCDVVLPKFSNGDTVEQFFLDSPNRNIFENLIYFSTVCYSKCLGNLQRIGIELELTRTEAQTPHCIASMTLSISLLHHVAN